MGMLDDPEGMLDTIRGHIREYTFGVETPGRAEWVELARLFTELDMHMVETASGARGDYMPESWVEDHVT